MADTELNVFVKDESGDLPLTVFKRMAGGDVELDMYIKTRGTGVPPEPEENYTVADFLSGAFPYVAHRCGGGDWPEFSEAGILGSLARGYQAFEMSVFRCSTGEFVLSHDWTTERMTGEYHEIYNTPWSVLSTLTSTAEFTSDPSQPRQPLLRLEDALALVGNRVVFLDHKSTSDKLGNSTEQAGRDALLDRMDFYPDSENHLVWKSFKGGYEAAAMAKARGYKTWGAYYSGEIDTAPTRLENFDILGLEYNALIGYWDTLNATGKKGIAHIITTIAQRNAAQTRGAFGYMTSNPKLMP